MNNFPRDGRVGARVCSGLVNSGFPRRLVNIDGFSCVAGTLRANPLRSKRADANRAQPSLAEAQDGSSRVANNTPTVGVRRGLLIYALAAATISIV